MRQAIKVIEKEILDFEEDAISDTNQKIVEIVPKTIIPKINELANNFIAESKADTYFIANTFHKELSTKVYRGIKTEIKSLEQQLYKEIILPRERELNDKYKIFVQQVAVSNTHLIDQMNQDEQVLKKLSKSLQGARIKKNILNPNNYIFRMKG